MGIKPLFAASLLLVSFGSYAVPTLYFDGSFHYDSSTGLMTVDAVLNNAQDTSLPVTLATSSFGLTTQWLGTTLFGPVVEATFGSAGSSADDFLISDSDTSAALLSGDIDNLLMSGFQGNSLGFLSGNLQATAGSLINDFFDDTSLFALQLNLSTVFSSNMFASDFDGQIDGNLTGITGTTSIAEPSTLIIFTLGCIALIYTRSQKKWGN
jgi:hypothetical protein